MTHLINTNNTEPTIIHDIEINWSRLIARRPTTLAHSADLPKYLLLPEIKLLLDNALDAADHLIINTLWHTGARVSELVALRPCDFNIDNQESFVSIQSLKKRPGRKKKNQAPIVPRMVPITELEYLWELESYIKTNRLKRTDNLFKMTRQTVDNRIKKIVLSAEKKGLHFDISVTAKTFRHSFAVNSVLHFRPISTVQQWLGHERRETTEIYTQVMAGDTAHEMKQVKFR